MEFEFKNKRVDSIFRILGFMGVIVVIITWIWFTPSSDEINKQWLKQIAGESFQGEVDTMYVDERNHNAHWLILKRDSVREYPESWESRIEKGDTLIKRRNEMTLTIRKKNGKVMVLDYTNMLNVKQK